MGPDDHGSVAPLLVLGLGNPLLRDDGLGLELLKRLNAACDQDARVEWTDGGTQGLALLGRLAGRHGLLVLDCVCRGGKPGDVYVLDGGTALLVGGTRGTTAHEGGAGPLLAAAAVLGDLPARVVVVGIEPAEVRTGLGLSDTVRRSVQSALGHAMVELERLRAALAEEPEFALTGKR